MNLSKKDQNHDAQPFRVAKRRTNSAKVKQHNCNSRHMNKEEI